jgi:hypothetical protein
MYVIIYTHPNVSYALSVISRQQANSGIAYWTAVKTILKYLRRIQDIFLVYEVKTELVVKGYTDVSFQTDRDDLRS